MLIAEDKTIDDVQALQAMEDSSDIGDYFQNYNDDKETEEVEEIKRKNISGRLKAEAVCVLIILLPTLILLVASRRR